VYVPYFNQGFLPTEYWAGKEDDDVKKSCTEEVKYESRRATRHLPQCRGCKGGRCNKNCAMIFEELEDRCLGGTAAERHSSEEQRLTHVASTRAKDNLVFTKFDYEKWDREMMDYRNVDSEFMRELTNFLVRLLLSSIKTKSIFEASVYSSLAAAV
jgi:superfamily I DNA/RNA helicase